MAGHSRPSRTCCLPECCSLLGPAVPPWHSRDDFIAKVESTGQVNSGTSFSVYRKRQWNFRWGEYDLRWESDQILGQIGETERIQWEGTWILHWYLDSFRPLINLHFPLVATHTYIIFWSTVSTGEVYFGRNIGGLC